MKKQFLLVILIITALVFSCSKNVFAQNIDVLDSLLISVNGAKEDTIKVNQLNKICKILIRKDIVKAKTYAQNALELSEKIHYRKGVKVANTMLGAVNFYQNNLKAAEKFYSNALILFDEDGDIKGTSDRFINLGNVYLYQNSFDKAIQQYKKAIGLKKSINDKIGVSSCLNNIGHIYREQGHYAESNEYFKSSLDIAQETGDGKLISACLSNIGIVCIKNGDYTEAIEYIQKSLVIKKELGDTRWIPNLLMHLGVIYEKLGDFNKAIEYYKLSIDQCNEIGDKRGVAYCLSNISNSYLELGLYDEALAHINKGLEKAEEIEDQSLISQELIGLSRIYMLKKEYATALKNLEKALKISIDIRANNNIIRVYNCLSNIYFEKGEYNKATKYCQNALIANFYDFKDSSIYSNPTNLNAYAKHNLLETLSLKAKNLQFLTENAESTRNIEASFMTYKSVYRLINEIRSDYSHENTKFLLSEKTRRYFIEAINSSFIYNKLMPELVKSEDVFAFIEKSKSSTLAAYVSDSKIRSGWNITDTLLKKEKDIAIKRRFYDTKIQEVHAKKEIYDTLLLQNYQEKLFNYSRQYDTLINRLKNEYPEYYKLKYEQRVASIKEVQQSLDENSALINYFVGDTTLFIGVVTKSESGFKTIKIDSVFNDMIIDYHLGLKLDFGEKEQGGSNKLYKYLISPIEEFIQNKEQLVIIPDEHLYYLPFETLCKDATAKNDLSKLDYLVRNYSISYHHSATLWLNSIEMGGKRTERNNSFVGFAPVFDSKTNNGYIASREWISDSTSTEPSTRSVSSDFKSFNSLPYSEDEINSIVKLFAKKKKEAKGYFHTQANEENFKSNIKDYNFIHIASHSFTNDKYPGLSGIAFSQPDTTEIKNEKGNDGILYSGETYGLALSNADLIVLSSCKSGLGKLIKGEGFLSLSRGFLYSGAPNVIFSLWSIKDEQTKDLMVQFYKQVLKGQDYSKALRKAKLKLLNNKKTAYPKYWAGMVLVGE